MEQLIAVAVDLESAERCYFLTVSAAGDDDQAIVDLVLAHSRKFALGARITRTEVCYSLQDAANEPYFYECLSALSIQLAKHFDSRMGWSASCKADARAGKLLLYCGNPSQRSKVKDGFWSMRAK